MGAEGQVFDDTVLDVFVFVVYVVGGGDCGGEGEEGEEVG